MRYAWVGDPLEDRAAFPEDRRMQNLPMRDTRRGFASLAGLAVCAAVFPWFYHEFDIPFALRAGGVTGAVLWGAFVAAWVWGTWRFDALCAWAKRHRETLLAIARWSGIAYGPIFVGLFYLMWIAGRWNMGEWPRAIPMHDPKSIPAAALVYVAIVAWGWCLPLAVAFPFSRAIRGWWRHDQTARARLGDLGATLAGLGFATAWIALDPQSLVKWFLD